MMPWLLLLALMATAMVLGTAAQLAGGLVRGTAQAKAWWILAVLVSAPTFWFAYHEPLYPDYAAYLGAAIPAVGACIVFGLAIRHAIAKRHLATWCSLLFTALLIVLGLIVIRDLPASEFDFGRRPIQEQIEQLDRKRQALVIRRDEGIPEVRARAERDADTIRSELAAKPGPEQTARLEGELREIARLLLALDEESNRTKSLISRLSQEARRLERTHDAAAILGQDSELAQELDRLWRESAAGISRPLDEKLGSNAITRAQVDAKLAELKR